VWFLEQPEQVATKIRADPANNFLGEDRKPLEIPFVFRPLG
jgi:hypothetical protein